MNPVDIPDVLSEQLRDKLSSLAVATITHQLQGRGIQHAFLSGLRPLLPRQRLVGRARTLRYVALREDRVSEFSAGQNAQRRIVEAVTNGDVIVIEARDVPDAGTVGDIYACLLYTSPSPRDKRQSRMPSSA